MKKKQIHCFFILIMLFLVNITLHGQEEEVVVLTETEKEIFETSDDSNENEISEESEYDIVIMDVGFNTWLNRIAQPKGYYSQGFMENRNYLYVLEWNRRVLQPSVFDPLLYELRINYEQNVDYGYDVNYQLYNYFIYFQRRYNQRLGPFLPRI
ncbi:DUF6146 family protein [Croceitalea rosinachiae]|uniref:DUF6146 family protein n=1 Tax=Croceitalea rosinachiae TaxID=3075596 RepID=A0ABU3AC45_9FLAO|nr:DUF6146 family protein [Croceitalea sp. F388]MDT0607455.1 DUF6146 family protein [Croceitalea sp. F388]